MPRPSTSIVQVDNYQKDGSGGTIPLSDLLLLLRQVGSLDLFDLSLWVSICATHPPSFPLFASLLRALRLDRILSFLESRMYRFLGWHIHTVRPGIVSYGYIFFHLL